MGYATPMLTDFSGGEVSSLLGGRVDTQGYKRSCRNMVNMIPHPVGPAMRRPGTRYVGAAYSNSYESRLVPFETDDGTVYILEFSENTMRVIKDGAVVGGYTLTTSITAAQAQEMTYVQYTTSLYIAHRDFDVKELAWGGADTSWSISGMSISTPWNSSDNYPGAIAIWQGRMILAGSYDEPQRITGSDVGDWTDHDASAAANPDDPWDFILGDQRWCKILWLSPAANVLMAGTDSSVWVLGGRPFYVGEYEMAPQVPYGASAVQGLKITQSLLYVDSSGEALVKAVFNYQEEGYQAEDMNLQHHTILSGGVRDMALMQKPVRQMLCVTEEGEMPAIVSSPSGLGWYRNVTDGNIENVAVAPTFPDERIYIVVTREIDGTTERYIEYFEDLYWGDDDRDVFFVDSGITQEKIASFEGSVTYDATNDYFEITKTAHGLTGGEYVNVSNISDSVYDILNDGDWLVVYVDADTFRLSYSGSLPDTTTPFTADFIEVTDTVTGLDHLEGEEVSVCVDGAMHPERTVVSGEITLQGRFNKVHAGLACQAYFTPNRIEAGGETGPSQGKPKRINGLTIRFYQSLGCEVGEALDSLQWVPFRDPSDEMSAAPELKDGDRTIKFDAGYDPDADMYIVQNQPLPLTVLALMIEMETYEHQ